METYTHDTTELATGIYVIRIQTKNGLSIVKKLIKV